MALIELPHLSIGTPERIACPRVAQVGRGGRLEPGVETEAAGQLVGQCLMVDKAVGAGGADGSLVQVHRLERSPLDARNLRADHHRTTLEVLRTIRRQGPKLSLVLSKRFSMLGVSVWAHGLAACGARQASIEMAFRLLQGKERQLRGRGVPS